MSQGIFEKAKIKIAGENALIIYFSDNASNEVAAIVQNATKAIQAQLTDDIIDLIPSYASILVVFNQLDIDHHHLRNKLRIVLSHPNEGNLTKGEVIELPVYYSQESGPELALIAKQAKLSIEQIIELHQAQEYRVYAIGFAPGFAYLGEVDKRIAMPRLSTPRLKVPKGAVAIADRQTAVYPSESPGGWNIIGLCPVTLFDPNAENSNQSMPVQVGDIVKFKPVDKQEFLALGGLLPAELGQQV